MATGNGTLSLADVSTSFKPRCKQCNQLMETHGYGCNKKTSFRKIAYSSCTNRHCSSFQKELAFEVVSAKNGIIGVNVKIDWR